MHTNTERLEERDAQIVELRASGRSVAEVASALSLSCATVYRHLARPTVRAALAARQSELWAPVASELRSGALFGAQRLRWLAEHAAHESTQARASAELLRLALALDELTQVKQRLAELEARLDAAEQTEHSNGI